MARIVIHQPSVMDKEAIQSLCPFDAIEIVDGRIDINAACKMCKICIRKSPSIFEWCEDPVAQVDKSKWRGIAVYVDHLEGKIHPVTLELLGKAKEMAAKINHPVYAVFIGDKVTKSAEELLHYGVKEVHVYDDPALKHFRVEPYAAAFEDFINKNKPTIVLVGGTTIGRSLAPRIAARFRTGLTADCTILDVQENTDLDQIRPAFGGNIMAHIFTPNHRPQFATVRYKIFSAPCKSEKAEGRVVKCDIAADKLKSNIEVLEVRKKQVAEGIENAEVIIAAGRAIKKAEDMAMINRLAELLNGKVAVTRPLIENGWGDVKTQVGLSGRTVKPKLIIVCGISGAIQFTAGMNNSDVIVAINNDPKASIFNVAHYGIVGDIYTVLPALIKQIEQAKSISEPLKCADARS